MKLHSYEQFAEGPTMRAYELMVISVPKIADRGCCRRPFLDDNEGGPVENVDLGPPSLAYDDPEEGTTSRSQLSSIAF